MLDTDTFKTTMIRFRDSSGKIVTLRDVPACYQDVGMRVFETSNFYSVYGVATDSDVTSTWYVESNLSVGSYIQLLGYRGAVGNTISNDCGYACDADDYFFFGGLKHPTSIKPIVCDDKLHLNYVDAADERTDIAYAFVKVAGHKIDADTALDRLRADLTPLRQNMLSELFMIIHGSKFKSYKQLAKAIQDIEFEEESNDYNIILDRNVFDLEDYIREYAITKPDWAYKWLSKYDHGLVSYFEKGTRNCESWDTTSIAGVWALTEEQIEYYKTLDEATRDKFIEQAFRHDMKLISDGDTAYCVLHTIYDKQSWQQLESGTEVSAIFEGVDFKYGEADQLLNMACLTAPGTDEHPVTELKYTVLQETKANPCPW